MQERDQKLTDEETALVKKALSKKGALEALTDLARKHGGVTFGVDGEGNITDVFVRTDASPGEEPPNSSKS